MRILIDTNIIGRLVQPEHATHAAVATTVETLIGDGHDLRTVPQILYEFWAIATRPAASNGLGLTIDEATLELGRIEAVFPLLRDERGVFSRWRHLVQSYGVCGKKTHDARIVAAMQRHGVSRLLTLNTTDFIRYRGIELVDVSMSA